MLLQLKSAHISMHNLLKLQHYIRIGFNPYDYTTHLDFITTIRKIKMFS